jgi:mediator of RNA polymerase II transcription subunit 13
VRPATTNKHQGDFEAVAYLAFSITRTTTPTPTSSKLRDWSPSEDIRAAEAELRQSLQLVAQDVSRPWLWLFKPTTVEKTGQNDTELPELEGYRLQRKSPSLSAKPRRSQSQANKEEASKLSI